MIRYRLDRLCVCCKRVSRQLCTSRTQTQITSSWSRSRHGTSSSFYCTVHDMEHISRSSADLRGEALSRKARGRKAHGKCCSSSIAMYEIHTVRSHIQITERQCYMHIMLHTVGVPLPYIGDSLSESIATQDGTSAVSAETRWQFRRRRAASRARAARRRGLRSGLRSRTVHMRAHVRKRQGVGGGRVLYRPQSWHQG